MKYFSDVEKHSKELEEIYEFLNLVKIIEINDFEIVEEGFFGKLLGMGFKAYGKLFKSIGAGLEAEKGKKWKTFEDSLFTKKDDAKKAINSKNPEDAIKFIEDARKSMVDDGTMDEKESYGYAALQAFGVYGEHKDDDNYKKAIGKYIKDCKSKGGSDADKIIADGQKGLKKGSENTEGDSGEPKEEEIKQDDQAADKSAKTLGGNSEKVKDAISPIVKTESKIDSLDDEIFEGDEGNAGKKSSKLKEKMGETLWNFRSKYLYASDPQIKNKFSKEQREINKKTVINFVSAMSAMKENIKGVTGDEIKNFVTALLQFPNINEIFK